ncbi:hypothetical protein VZO05_00315 [Aggregatilineales bacterium SYSU G02658]
MNDAQRRDLADLRAAAHERNPEQCQFLTKRLLGQLSLYVALSVALEQVWRFVDIFESYYPDEGWVRRMLVSIASYGMAPDDQVAEAALSQSFTEPGCANFLKAVYDVVQAMQQKHTPEARVSFMTSAIVNAIMAELVEAWYGERPEAWAHQRGHPGDPEALELAYLFWIDADTAALDTTCWLEVADRLEKALTRH